MAGITLDTARGDLLVVPPTNPSTEVKAELGGRWDKSEEAWRLPPTSLNVLRLAEFYGDEFIESAPEDVRDLATEPWGFKGFSPEERREAKAHPSWEELFNFQRTAVEYLVCNPHAAGLLGLSWGLGKAATTITAADLIQAKRVLVLAPLTLGKAWGAEVDRWSADKPLVKRATAKDPFPEDESWTVANHEIVREVVLRDEDGKILDPDWAKNPRAVKKWIGEGPTEKDKGGKTIPKRRRLYRVRREYLEVEWDLIIVDESVLLKNRKAVKGDILETLRKEGDPFVFELSASPTTKTNSDLWKQLKVLMPRAFSSYWRFAEFFTIVDKEGWGWTIEGNRPDRDPNHYCRDFLHIVSEEEAGLELPEYHESVVDLEATPKQRKALDSMMNDWIVELEDDPKGRVEADNWLSRMTRLQQITSNLGALPKPDGQFYKESSAKGVALADLIRQGDLPTPLLVWTWYVETTDLVEGMLNKSFPELDVVSVSGRLTTKRKDEGLQAFKDGDVDVLVCQMGVGKFGHTFTKTRSIYYHDRTFDSDAYLQSRRRVRRIGLEHNPVLIVPKIKGSADEFIDANLEGKLTSVSKLTKMNLAELLRSVRSEL